MWCHHRWSEKENPQRPADDSQVEGGEALCCMTEFARVTSPPSLDFRKRILRNLVEGTWERPGILLVNSIGNVDKNVW
jgi:hypothetical protein